MKRKNIEVRLGEAEKVAAVLGRTSVGLVGPPPESEVEAALRRLADRPHVPRTAEQTFALIEGARASWGKERTIAERTMMESFAKLVGAPIPSASATAGQHATKYAAWLTESDRELAEDWKRSPLESANGSGLAADPISGDT
jgi:hypothetical protein